MIAARTNDGRFGSYRFPVGTLPGEWEPVLPAFVNDPNAWLKDVRPFLVRNFSRFETDGPFRLKSEQYARELAEVQSVGSASRRDTHQRPDTRRRATGRRTLPRRGAGSSARFRPRKG